MVYGLWSMVYGLWSLVFGPWSIVQTLPKINLRIISDIQTPAQSFYRGITTN